MQTLISLDLNYFSDYGDFIVFSIKDLMKTTRPSMQKVTINAFTDEKLCALHTMRYYILKTELKRRSRKLLVSYKTFKEITTSTVDRWLKQVLDRSGIDSTTFTAHSVRGASSSVAYASGVQLIEIMEIANWANAKTFYTYYHKEATCNFSNSVLNSTT
jgi:hypothetical protein